MSPIQEIELELKEKKINTLRNLDQFKIGCITNFFFLLLIFLNVLKFFSLCMYNVYNMYISSI